MKVEQVTLERNVNLHKKCKVLLQELHPSPLPPHTFDMGYDALSPG